MKEFFQWRNIIQTQRKMLHNWISLYIKVRLLSKFILHDYVHYKIREQARFSALELTGLRLVEYGVRFMRKPIKNVHMASENFHLN